MPADLSASTTGITLNGAILTIRRRDDDPPEKPELKPGPVLMGENFSTLRRRNANIY